MELPKIPGWREGRGNPPTATSSQDSENPLLMGEWQDLFIYFISPLTSSHLQLRPGQDKAKQFNTYNNTELHME